MVEDAELLELVELEVRELLKSYQFSRRHDSGNQGLGAAGFETATPSGKKTIDELMEAVDKKRAAAGGATLTSRSPCRSKIFFSIFRTRHGGYGAESSAAR